MTCPRPPPQWWWSTLWSPRTHLCWIFFWQHLAQNMFGRKLRLGPVVWLRIHFTLAWELFGKEWSQHSWCTKKDGKSIYDRTLPGRWRWCSCSDSHGEAQSLASHLCQMSFFKNPCIKGFPRCHWTCRPGGWVEPVDQLQCADHQVGTLLGTFWWWCWWCECRW